MRTWTLLGALVLCPLLVKPALAQAQEKALEERIQKLEEELHKIKQREEQEREGVPPDVMRPEVVRPEEPSSEPGIGPLPEVAKERRRQVQAPLSFGTTGSGRLVYAKPFVSAPKAIVGGYMDMFYTMQAKGALTGESINNGAGPDSPGLGRLSNSFDSQRFVPFIYADITEHVKMAAELEVEHGVRESTASGREIEFGTEFATIDYLIKEPVNFRTGVILLPVGKFNLLHDSPLNDVGPRPLVDQLIIPTTMSETGAGFYGTFYPGRTSKLDYELYVTTGPNGYNTAGTSTINEMSGLRGTRQRKSFADDGLDNNNGKAVVGRLAYSPLLGMEIGGSGYHGTYDPQSKRELTIMAMDWTFQRGPWELIGEAAWSYAQNASRCLTGVVPPADSTVSCVNGFAIDSISGRPIPQRSHGYYIQGNYHFMPELLRRLAPSHFSEASTFTAVLRYDRVNTNADFSGGLGDLEKLTLALNFRPVEDTVYRIAYECNMMGVNPITAQRVTGNNAIVLSVATYF